MCSPLRNVGDGHHVDLVPFVTIDTEEVRVTVVASGTVDLAARVELDGTFPFPPGLALHLDEPPVLLVSQVVPALATERQKYVLSRGHESRQHGSLGPLTDLRRRHALSVSKACDSLNQPVWETLTLGVSGPVAHLVERRAGSAEVTGSIPVGSTSNPSSSVAEAAGRPAPSCVSDGLSCGAWTALGPDPRSR